MSAGNGTTKSGVIRIGSKGRKQFAIGDEGEPFEVDVVDAFQQWQDLYNAMVDEDGNISDQLAFHERAVQFVKHLAGDKYTGDAGVISRGEAFDFLARLREQYDEVADFFQPKSREERGSPASSGVELRFSEEGSLQGSTN